MFAMQRICMLPGGDSRFSEPNMAISGNISVVIKRRKDMFAISSLQNSLTSPAWGEDQRRWEGHSEVSKTQQLGTLKLGQVAKKCQVYLEELSVGGQITAMAPWDAEKTPGKDVGVWMLSVRVESYNFQVPGDFSKTWWYADALSFEMFWRWSNSLGYYLWEAVGAYSSPDRIGYGRMILPFKKIPLRPIWPVLKRFGLTNVQLLNSCTGWTKHILRALPPTDTFGVAAFVWISLRGGCHPKGFWGTGGQVDVVHLPRMIPDFGTPIREHYHLCLARCWDHVVDSQIDVHKHSAIIVTILTIVMVILHIHSPP